MPIEESDARLDRLETLVRGLFNAVCALAHEMTGKELQVLLPENEESPPRRWVADERSVAWLNGDEQRFSVDLATSPATHLEPHKPPLSIQ